MDRLHLQETVEDPSVSVAEAENATSMPDGVQTEIRAHKPLKNGTWKKDFKDNWQVYLIIAPVIIFFFLFSYLPMFGLLMSFQDFNIRLGVFGSEWIGFANFERLFSSPMFLNALKNTVIIGLLNLVFGFTTPIIFALLITQIKNRKFRRVIQICSYMPNFVASMVICTILTSFLSERGVLTNMLAAFGLDKQNWFANNNPPAFWLIYAISGAWQSFGYGSIMYVSAISNINGDLYEAACLDGANRWQLVWKITLPCIMPMIIMMLTLQVGTVFKAGYDRILLLYNSQIWDVADTLYTLTYRMGLIEGDYGFAAASGLFQSVVCTVLLCVSNWLNKKTTSLSLF